MDDQTNVICCERIMMIKFAVAFLLFSFMAFSSMKHLSDVLLPRKR